MKSKRVIGGVAGLLIGGVAGYLVGWLAQCAEGG